MLHRQSEGRGKGPRARLALLLCAVGLSVACSVCLSGTSQQKEDRLSEAEFQALVARLPRFGKQKEYLVYEGDLVLTESELRAHLAQVATLRKTRGRNLGEMQPSGQCVVCLKQRFCSTDETEDAVLFTPEQRCSFAIKQRMDKIRSSPAVIREEFKRLQQQIKKGHIDKGTVDLDAAPQDCKLGFWLNNARFYKMKHIELRFAVDSRSFGPAYGEFVENLDAAARSWGDICGSGCRFSFAHDRKDDVRSDLKPGGNLLFVVRMVSEWDDSRPEIALSFLPRQEEGRRYLRIFPRFFHAGNNPIGILRHELGHILGLRHEHLRSQTQCISASKQENAFNASWVPVSEYDPESIMHYDCTAPVFGREEFSSGDCKLIQALYGDDVIDVDKEALLQQIDNVQSFKEVWETCKQGIAELKAAGLLQ